MRRGRRVDTGGVRVRAMERSREFDDIGNEYRSFTGLELEKCVLIDALGMGMDHGRGPAATKAEIVWRDREYAEDQENSRREFEREMSAAADAREVNRQKFDEALAQRQMDHSSKLAREQLNTAQAAAKAAKWAAWAAGIAALGAIGQLVVAIVGSLLAEP